jgi:hypothetical protein
MYVGALLSIQNWCRDYGIYCNPKEEICDMVRNRPKMDGCDVMKQASPTRVRAAIDSFCA